MGVERKMYLTEVLPPEIRGHMNQQLPPTWFLDN